MTDVKEKEFIGKEYDNEVKKQEILAKYDKFQLKKLEWLNEMYDDDKTKFGYWRNYNNSLHYDEVNKDRDIMHFSTEELISLISSNILLESSTREGLLTIARGYCSWAEKIKRDINFNPASGIKSRDINAINKRLVAKRILGMDDFYDMCDEMEKKVEVIDIIPLILFRYGITGRELVYARTLRWEDIDVDNMMANIINDNGELISRLPIDDRFVMWIEKTKNLVEYENEVGGRQINREVLDDYGFVIKKSQRSRTTELIENYNTVNSRIFRAYKSIELDRIPPTDLMMARKIEVLLGIREKRRIGRDDVRKVVELFHSANKEFAVSEKNLRNRYEAVTGDKVLNRYAKDFAYTIQDLDFAKRISEETGLEIVRLDLK